MMMASGRCPRQTPYQTYLVFRFDVVEDPSKLTPWIPIVSTARGAPTTVQEWLSGLVRPLGIPAGTACDVVIAKAPVATPLLQIAMAWA